MPQARQGDFLRHSFFLRHSGEGRSPVIPCAWIPAKIILWAGMTLNVSIDIAVFFDTP
jgi:hypothetical protein